MVDSRGRVCAGAREIKPVKDAGRSLWWCQRRARGRRSGADIARHPRARGRGISHLMAGLPPAVLLGGENIAVSAARSLSREGARVHALGDITEPVRASRHCYEFVDVGARKGVADRYLEWLAADGP